MNDNQITLKQLMLIIMLSTGLVNHVMVIPVLLEVAGRDAWVSVLLVLIVYLLWIILIHFILKKMNRQPIYQWLANRCGQPMAVVLLLPVALLICFMIFTTFKDTLTWTITSYLPQTPILILGFVFTAICLACALTGIQSIAIASGVILFFVVLLGFFVMSSNFVYKDYARLFPIFEEGLNPVFKGMVSSGGGLVEMMLIVFVQHRISSAIRLRKLWLLALILVGLTLGPLTGSITIFSPNEASHQRYPAYEQWRLLQIGRYISHVDFFSIYQWLSGALIRITFGLYLLSELFPWSPKNKKRFLLISSALLALSSLVPITDPQLYKLIKNLYFPSSLLILLGYSLLLGLLAIKKGENSYGNRTQENAAGKQ